MSLFRESGREASAEPELDTGFVRVEYFPKNMDLLTREGNVELSIELDS